MFISGPGSLQQSMRQLGTEEIVREEIIYIL